MDRNWQVKGGHGSSYKWLCHCAHCSALPAHTSFYPFSASDLQSIFHLDPSHGSTQWPRKGLGNQSPVLRSIVSRTVSAAGVQNWSHLIQKAAGISSGELYPKGFSLTPQTANEPMAPPESEERGIPPLESTGVCFLSYPGLCSGCLP